MKATKPGFKKSSYYKSRIYLEDSFPMAIAAKYLERELSRVPSVTHYTLYILYMIYILCITWFCPSPQAPRQ